VPAPAPDIELDLDKIAVLSRLALDDEERVTIQKDLLAILSQFSTLEEIGEDSAEETHDVSGVRNALREDGEPNRFEGVEDIQGQAPRFTAGHVVVPKNL
jgi:aspartyl/glutamyl-tRNA(Asn/Gln) amidotransferase C subunit